MFQLFAYLTFWCFCVVGCFAMVFLGRSWSKRRQYDCVNAEFATRDSLTSEQFAETFFAESKERKWVAQQLYEFVAERSFVKAARIRPTDRLQKIGIRFADDPDLAWSLEAQFGLYLGGVDFEKTARLEEIETFEGLVDELIAAKHQPWPIEA